ncbi:MAG: YdcF family protein [Cyanobacteria bacterium J06648_16]
MLDAPACNTIGTSQQWLQFTQTMGKVVNQPSSLLLIVGMVGLVAWLGLQHRALRRWSLRASLGAMAVVVLMPLLGSVLLTTLIPADSGQGADAIVILGRGHELREMRTAVAADLLAAGRAPRVFVSGGGDAPNIVELLREEGANPAAVDGENCSRTTKENALYTAQILKPQGVERIILVTDAPHTLRSHLTFRNVGFEVIPHPSPFPPGFSRYSKQVIGLRETAGFVAYGLLGRY